MDLKRRKTLLNFIRVVLAILMVYQIREIKLINDLKSNDSVASFKVLDKTCRDSRRPSYITIETPKGDFELEYSRTRCFEIAKGDYVDLYHDSSYELFFSTDQDKYYLTVYALSVALIISLIPWNKLSSYFQKKN